MKTLIRSILLLSAAAVFSIFSIGCERHNFDETQKLHKEHHGAHGEHAGHGAEAKDSHAHDAGEKEGAHSGEKKANH